MKQLTLFASEDTDTSQSASQSTGGQKGIFFPCPTARKMEIGEERCNHIKHCPECKRLIHELDKECGVKR